MYFQKPRRNSEKPGRNSENLEKISKKPMATLFKWRSYFLKNYFNQINGFGFTNLITVPIGSGVHVFDVIH